ncbi:hypothetical protein [Streptomyces roseolus]|nr:hypothetical protein [Streptomyces roseolus]GGR16999.1 hypothetical protein GCM10010282_06610 [Streptomyces roseolus]
MRRVRTSPFLPHTDDVRGFVFDVTTGLLREIHPVENGSGSGRSTPSAVA